MRDKEDIDVEFQIKKYVFLLGMACACFLFWVLYLVADYLISMNLLTVSYGF